MMFSTYAEALDYIYSLTKTGTHRIFGHIGLERIKYLLSLIDNPQDNIKIIHVAGTSGKGGTSYILSELLQKITNKKIGLHVSPHLIDIRERIQINGQLIDKESFVKALNTLYPAIQIVSESFFGIPSYFEVMISMMYTIFRTQGVDYAIVEAGCGGLYDGTNVTTKPKYCIITKQGYDHMEIVGESMTEITRNDAGIITPSSTVITLQHEQQVCNDIIDYRCHRQDAKKVLFDMNNNIQNIIYEQDKTVFDFVFPPKGGVRGASTSLIGPFHLENLGLALTAFFTIVEQEKLITHNENLKTVLENLHRKGRFDSIEYQGKQLLLDGAHNVQKMEALIDTLTTLYPQQLLSFYLSFKEGKQRQEMLDIIMPYAKEIIIGDFMTTQDFKLQSVSPDDILEYLQTQGYMHASINTDIHSVLDNHSLTDQPLVITGSLYFLSAVYPIIQQNT